MEAKQRNTLIKPTRCACCFEPMSAGEEFRWHEKKIQVGSSVRAGYKIVHRPAHVNPACRVEREQHKRNAELAKQTLEAIALLETLGEGAAPAIEILRAKHAALTAGA